MTCLYIYCKITAEKNCFMFQRLIALGYHVITIDYRGEGSFPVFPKIVLSGRYFSVIFNFLNSWRSLPIHN